MFAPRRLVIGDRATFEWKNKSILVKEIVERAAYTWFKTHLPQDQTPSQILSARRAAPGPGGTAVRDREAAGGGSL